jgi:hypothetical protein
MSQATDDDAAIEVIWISRWQRRRMRLLQQCLNPLSPLPLYTGRRIQHAAGEHQDGQFCSADIASVHASNAVHSRSAS